MAKAKNKTLSVSADYFTDSMRLQVSSWLSENGCSFVVYALESDKDISGLIQIFQGGK